MKLRVRCPNGGDAKIEWLTPGSDAKDAKAVPFTLKPGDWQELSINIPAEGRIGILRVYVPAQKQSVDVDWIELKAMGKPRRWEY